MSDYLTEIEQRLHEILDEGRGADGTMGSEVQARAIPEDTFLRQDDNATLNNPSFPASTFDCRYVLRFLEARDDPSFPAELFDHDYVFGWRDARSRGDGPMPDNPYNDPQFEAVKLEVTVGYLYGADMEEHIHARPGETASAEVARADRRAISDGMRINRALRFGPLRGDDTDPVMVACSRGSTRVVDIGSGRLLGVTTFSLVLQHAETTAYGP